ncbi:polysaccharide deacetylase family protein [Parasediminibacterium sp. JCM 36343]|uniref:polysaccharide deacetylase family protein n=1 Tax=Parasediminibacterium sp. JCM 36343 TaxID=3374279 RepID=UPI0039781F9B
MYFLLFLLVGIPKLTYSVPRAEKNKHFANSQNRKPASIGDAKQHIYLTFDDGPQNGTAVCMELCKKWHVKATFFMVANHANSPKMRAIVQKIKACYPALLVANHSTDHAGCRYVHFYKNPVAAAADFNEAQQALSVPYKIIRLPGNSAWACNNWVKASALVKPLCNILVNFGYNVVGWDVEWRFNHANSYPIQQPAAMAHEIENALDANHVHTSKHIVLLAHDRMFRKQRFADSLEKLIAILKKDPRNVFETIDQYPGLKLEKPIKG